MLNFAGNRFLYLTKHDIQSNTDLHQEKNSNNKNENLISFYVTQILVSRLIALSSDPNAF